MENRNASMAASPTSPRITAPTAAMVISVPTPIWPRTNRRSVDGTNVNAPTASAADNSTSSTGRGPWVQPIR